MQTQYSKKQWFAALICFSLCIFFLADAAVFAYDENLTVTNLVHNYFQVNAGSMRTFLFGIGIGMLMNHFFGWNKNAP